MVVEKIEYLNDYFNNPVNVQILSVTPDGNICMFLFKIKPDIIYKVNIILSL